MKNRILFIFVLILLFSFYSKVSASQLCSSNGYTVATINGIFTDEKGAIDNKNRLKDHLPPTYNNEPVTVDYLYNPTHLAGVGDLMEVVAQGVFDQKSDYDLTEMLNDASQKVSTQKLLLVAHSQGNFYANNFYDKTASQPGGVPSQSIGVYSLATPADHVAGGGKYLTSDTDRVISSLVGRFIKILPPNIHIPLQSGDDKYGHSLTDVYLKYQSDRIVSDIKSSLDKLQTNDEQDSQGTCLYPPELSITHKIEGSVLAIADPTANVIKTGIVGVYDAGVYLAEGARNITLAIGNIFSGLSASVVESLPDTNSLTTILPDVADSVQTPEITKDSPPSELVDDNKTPAQEEIVPIETIATSAEAPVDQNIEAMALPETSIKKDIPVTYLGTGGGGGGSNIVSDTTVPVISITGANPISVDVGATYTDLGATATDNIDTNMNVITSGNVDTSVIGVYTLTYTATDSSGNISTATRTVNVVNPAVPDITPPVISIIGASSVNVSKDSSYVDAGATANDAIDGVRTVVTTGDVDTSIVGTYTITYTASDLSNNISTATRTVNVIKDLDFPVITMNGNAFEVVPFGSIYTDPGATAFDAVDGVLNVVETGRVNTSFISTYPITYTATDYAGNTTVVVRNVKVATYQYIPKYKFGTENGDDNNWQVWDFNGSDIYNWSDTYVNNYLHEQFKIQDFTPGFWCSQCLQRGIFNHDPQKGFETSDVTISSLENNPQNNEDGITYDVSLQWDSTGYTYTISHDGSVNATGHTNISNVNGDMWVGWDGSYNNFKQFPSGDWYGAYLRFPLGYSGGGSMMLEPYPVYVYSGPVLSEQKMITSFNFDSLSPSVIGNIDENTHTISLSVPFGSDVTSLVPTITVSSNASIIPNTNLAQNFTNPVIYTVTAENGSTQEYTITVIVLPDSNHLSDITPPIISSLSLSSSPILGYAKIGDIVTLSVTADAAGYTPQDIKINNVVVTNFTDNGNGTYTAIYTVAKGDNDITSGTIPVSVILSDASGNSNLAYTTVIPNNLKIDANPPTFVSAKVATITTVEALFSEDVDGSTLNKSGSEFTVSGHTVTGAHELSDGVVTLTLSSDLGTGETPSITFTSTNFKDIAGNQAINPTTVIATNNI